VGWDTVAHRRFDVTAPNRSTESYNASFAFEWGHSKSIPVGSDTLALRRFDGTAPKGGTTSKRSTESYMASFDFGWGHSKSTPVGSDTLPLRRFDDTAPNKGGTTPKRSTESYMASFHFEWGHFKSIPVGSDTLAHRRFDGTAPSATTCWRELLQAWQATDRDEPFGVPAALELGELLSTFQRGRDRHAVPGAPLGPRSSISGHETGPKKTRSGSLGLIQRLASRLVVFYVCIAVQYQ